MQQQQMIVVFLNRLELSSFIIPLQKSAKVKNLVQVADERIQVALMRVTAMSDFKKLQSVASWLL